MREIGLFGGSFDPVHVGHLHAALEVMECLALDELRFIPCCQSPGKDPPRASGTLRCQWLDLALRDRPGWVVDDRELRRGGVSYTVDTLEEIRADEPESRLYWLVGSDAFSSVHRWREPDLLGQLAHWVVLLRPCSSLLLPAEAPRWCREGMTDDPARLRRDLAGAVLRLPVTPLGISATAIRDRIRRGLSLDYLVPAPLQASLERAECYEAP